MDVKSNTSQQATQSNTLKQSTQQLCGSTQSNAKVETRLMEFSFDNILGRFRSVIGKSYMNPLPHETIPKLHDRKRAHELYCHQKRLVFYFVNPEPLVDDIYISGVCPNGATMKLKLLNLRPFFMSSVPLSYGDNKPSQSDVDAFRRHLNQRKFWPRSFPGNIKAGRLPLDSIELISRKDAVEYRGIDPVTKQRKEQWVYVLKFWDMSCWRHYRSLLTPLRKHERTKFPDKWGDSSVLNKAELNWQPLLNHERSFHTYIQMLFNSNPIAPKTWLEIDATKCKWIPLDAPDSFGGHSDVEWTEDKLFQLEAKAKEDFDAYNEMKQRYDNGESDDGSSSSEDSIDSSDAENAEKNAAAENTLSSAMSGSMSNTMSGTMSGSMSNTMSGTLSNTMFNTQQSHDSDSDINNHNTSSPKQNARSEWIRKRARETTQKRKFTQQSIEKRQEKFAKKREALCPTQCRRTRCILEGEIDYRDLIRRPDIVGGGPCTEAYFDIETASGKIIRYTLQGKIRPPWPDDENVIPLNKRKPMDTMDDYEDLMSRSKDKTLTEQEMDQILPELNDGPKLSKVESKWFAGATGKARKQHVDTKQRSIFSFVKHRVKTEEEEIEHHSQRLLKRKALQADIDAKELRERNKRIAKHKEREKGKSRHVHSHNNNSTVTTGEPEYKPLHTYPDPNNPDDPITYICTKFKVYGDDYSFLTVIHSLKSATERKELKNAVKYRWSGPTKHNEWAMLSHWSHMITSQMDTEFLWQYNGIGYDIPYMAIRGKYLNCLRFDRLGRFLALPHDQLFDERRYDQCRNRFIAKIGRKIHRRDADGHDKEEIDFPGVRINIPGLLLPDTYKTIRAMTFNTLEFGTLKEVAKKYTKCRCKTFVEPEAGTIEFDQDLCDHCGHDRRLHCRQYVAPDNPNSEKCKHCSFEKKAHDPQKDPCRSKVGPRKRDLKGVLITPFFCTDDDTRAVEEYYCERDVDATLEVTHQNQMFPSLTELSCLTRTGINDLINRGATKKTWNQIVFEAHHGGWLLNEQRRQYMQFKYGIKPEPVPEYAKTKEEREEEMAADNRMTKADRIKAKIKYTGGYVRDPKPGMKDMYIDTLDWNSLYPSIAIAHNLCWSTWLDFNYDSQARLWLPLYGKSYDEFVQNKDKYILWRLSDLKPTPEEVGDRDLILVIEDWDTEAAEQWTAYQLWQKMQKQYPTKAPHAPDSTTSHKPPLPVPEWKPQPGQKPKATCCFVVNRDSFFPPLLKNLLQGRAREKKLQKAAEIAKDMFKAGVFEAKQLALKLSANSAYGFTGAVKGFFGGVAIAIAICLLGRHYIMVSAITAENEFWSPTVYGDTDSIFTESPFLQQRYNAHVTTMEELKPSLKRGSDDLINGRIGFVDICNVDAKPWKTDDNFKHWAGKLTKLMADYTRETDPAKKFAIASCIAKDLYNKSVDLKTFDVVIPKLTDSSMSFLKWCKRMHGVYRDHVKESDPKKKFLLGTQFVDSMCQQSSLDQGKMSAKTISDRIQSMLREYQKDDQGKLTNKFEQTMNLEMEKQMNRAIFFRRKMYAFRFSWPDKDAGKFKMQGIAGKRRDNNLLVRNCYQKTIETLLSCDINILKYASASFVQTRNQPASKRAPSLKAAATEAASKKRSLTDNPDNNTSNKKQKTSDTRMQDDLATFDQMYTDEYSTEVNVDTDGNADAPSSTTKKVKTATPAKKPSKAQVIQPSFSIEELQEIDRDKKEREHIDTSTNTLLKWFKEACERLLSADLTYEEVQRTAAVAEGYSNERQAQVQAIRKSEREKGVKYDVGQRVAYVMKRPDKIKVKKNALAYDMGKMYGNAIETSSAEEAQVPLHKMYYYTCLKQKLVQALSLVMPKTVVDRFGLPFARRIYQEDLGFQDLETLFRDETTRARKRADCSMANDENNVESENPNVVLDEPSDNDDNENEHNE